MPLLFGSTAPTPDATSSLKGKVQLATGAETITGTDTTKVITVADLTAKMDDDGTLAGDSSLRIPTQAAVKDYVDDNSQGLIVHTAAQYATTGALPAIIYANGASGVGATLTGVSVGALAIDSNAPTVGQRILVKDQVSTFQNGIYTVTATGSGIAVFVLTRATDLDTGTEFPHAYVFVQLGTANDRTSWSIANPGPYTVGTTAVTWNQFFAAGEIDPGDGLSQSGNDFNVNVDTTSIAIVADTLQRTALTGDITASAGASVTTLASVITGGSVGDSTHIPVLTYDNKGRITAVSTATPSATAPTQRTFAFFAG